MIVNPTIFGTGSGVDTSQDTVVAEVLARGYTAHDASGSQIIGSGTLCSFSAANGYCEYPANIIIPSTVTSINGDTRAFKSHTEIESIAFETRSVSVALQNDAFNGCTNLESIDLPALLTMPGNAIFRGCTSLTSLVIPVGITTIGNYMCASCTGLITVELPSSLTSLGTSAFQGCTNLKTIKIQSNATLNSINTIGGNNMFYNCTSLEDIQVPTGWTGGGYTTTFISNGTSNYTNVLTHDSMVTMIAALYDFSGDTAHTLTLGTTNLARLSADEQAVATAKNWTLA